MSEVTPELMESYCMFRLEEVEQAKHPAQQKDQRAVKNNLKVEVTGFSTRLAIIAIHKDPEQNELKKILCEGTPVGGYVYNVVEDCYYVRCAGRLELGSIPIAFCLRAGDNKFWMGNVPMPESIIKKYLNEIQQIHFNAFKSAYKAEDHTYEYLQCVG